MALKLRPYQQDAQAAILRARDSGMRAQLVQLATGLGKSVIIATLPKLFELGPDDVSLIVAHRDELIEQLEAKCRDANPGAKIQIEKAERRAEPDANIVVGTVQTLTNKRLEDFIKRFGARIKLFVIDEAHHAAAQTYRAIVDAIREVSPGVMILGFTATPKRGDNVRLSDVFQDIVYTMDYAKAQDEGYLVPSRSYAVTTKTSLDEVASRAGDFVQRDLAITVNTKDRNDRILAAYLKDTPDQKALIFAASLEHAEAISDLFCEAGIKAAWASGETPKTEREQIVRDFRSGKLMVLVNYGLYLEGFDVPDIAVVINARPTKSSSLYQQIIGRGLRPVDEIANALSDEASALRRQRMIAQSAKPYAIILDMVDQAHRHDIVTLPSLLGLPPQIDPQGRLLSQVAERYLELERRDPKRAAKVRTADEIETALLELDREKEEKPSWVPVGPTHFRLELPIRRVARDRSGRPITDFQRRYEQFVSEARRIAPHEDADAFARRILNVDPSSIHEERTQIDVTPVDDAASKFVATLSNGTAQPRVLLESPSLPMVMSEVYTQLSTGALQAVLAASMNGKHHTNGHTNGHPSGHDRNGRKHKRRRRGK